MLGISPDDVTSHQAFKSKFNLPFTLLCDTDHSVAEKYGVWGEQSFNERKFMGISRSHFLVDESGKLADVQSPVSPNDSVARAVAAVLA